MKYGFRSFSRHRHHPGYIDFGAHRFPEVNPLPLVSVSQRTGKYFKLANYRYPSQGKRKGIIFFVHGYGEYCERYAYFAKAFAEAGYDFAGIDWRNFGHSLTDPAYAGISESWETQIEDHMAFFTAYDHHFNKEGVPRFLLGHS